MNDECIYNLNHDECAKINPNKVDAFFSFMSSPENPTTIYLDNSWGCTGIDLKPMIKAGETITTLFLSPKDNPVALQYNREDYGRGLTPESGIDCIHGDSFSRIISLQLLKDVDQSQLVKDGDTYMYNGVTHMFEPFALKEFYNNTIATLANHETRIDSLEAGLAALSEHVDQLQIYFQRLIDALAARVAIIEEKITPPAGTPANARILHGNINVYGDCTNSGSTSWGVYGHSPSSTIPNDMKFS